MTMTFTPALLSFLSNQSPRHLEFVAEGSRQRTWEKASWDTIGVEAVFLAYRISSRQGLKFF